MKYIIFYFITPSCVQLHKQFTLYEMETCPLAVDYVSDDALIARVVFFSQGIEFSRFSRNEAPTQLPTHKPQNATSAIKARTLQTMVSETQAEPIEGAMAVVGLVIGIS